MSNRCEDYPCCGHSEGECPSYDGNGKVIYKCLYCGKKLSVGYGVHALCRKCSRESVENDAYYCRED